MIWRLHNLGLTPDADHAKMRSEAARRMGVDPGAIKAVHVRRRSLDARRKPRIRYVYVLDVDTDASPRKGDARPAPQDPPDPLADPPRAGAPLSAPPVVVGAGPAGLTAAWVLARLGYAPILLERGRPVSERAGTVDAFWRGGGPDFESNELFGEGGAGAFSDGKLTTRIKDPLLRRFLQLLVEAGAHDSVLWEAKPHLGTEGVRACATGIRRLAESSGATVRFGCRVDGIAVRAGKVCGVITSEGDLPAGAVILASGASARDVYGWLSQAGVGLSRKPFQAGFRLEHDQGFIDEMQYGEGRTRWDLPPAEYALATRLSGPFEGVHSFCMCPGGKVIPTVSEPGLLCTNGMSYAARSGRRGNAAFVVTVPVDMFGTGPLSGIAFQREAERLGFRAGGGDYAAPGQRLRDFVRQAGSADLPEASYPLGVRPADLSGLYPDAVSDALRAGFSALCRRIDGFDRDPALLLGPESRASSPVRILRDRETGQSTTHPGLFPAGEGAGHAGGIASAGVDGLRAALSVARHGRPPA